MMDMNQLKNIIESAIFAAGQPLSIEKMQQLFEEPAPSQQELLQVLALLKTDYATRGVELKEVANGFRFQAKEEYAAWVSKLWEEKTLRYSRAFIETLALIAYRQPITRGEIEDVRGVAVSTHIIKSILDREWIRVVGHRDVPGKPALFATTKQFLDYFNLKTLDELPTLAELKSLDDIERRLNQQLEIDLTSQHADLAREQVTDSETQHREIEEEVEVLTAEVLM